MAATPASSATRSEPVEDPMNTLTPAAPGRRSSSGISRRIIAPCRRPRRRNRNACGLSPALFYRRAPRRSWSRDRCWAFRRPRSLRRAQPRGSRSPGLPYGSRPARGNAPGVSITPGKIWRPVASIVSPAPAWKRSPISAIFPAVIPMSRALSPGMVDHNAALQDHVEILGHWLIHCKAKQLASRHWRIIYK